MNKKIFKKPFFWVIVILFLIVVIVIDLFIQYVWAVKNVASGRWSLHIIGLALLSIILDYFHKRSDPKFRSNLKLLSRVSFWVAAIWVWRDFGFLEFLFFSATAAIVSRILKKILGKVVPQNEAKLLASQ